MKLELGLRAACWVAGVALWLEWALLGAVR